MATYTSLQSDIATWARRSDLTALIPSFIALAENEIFRAHVTPLRVREMETEATLTVANLAASLPADYLDARYIKLDNSTRETLYYFPPEKWKPSSYGYFTIVGNEIRLPNGVSNDLKLVYYAKPEPLATTATNTILDNYYGAYLEGALKFAFSYVRDTPKAQLAQGALDNFLATANLKNKVALAGPLFVVPA